MCVSIARTVRSALGTYREFTAAAGFATAAAWDEAGAPGCGQVVCLDSFLEKASSAPYNAFLRLDWYGYARTRGLRGRVECLLIRHPAIANPRKKRGPLVHE